MTRRLATFLAALAVLAAAACASDGRGGGEPRTANAACAIGESGRELDRRLAQAAAPGGDIRAVVERERVRIAELASEAERGALAQDRGQREVACISTAMRAWGALLYAPGAEERQNAMHSILRVADQGRAACDLLAQQNRLDAGASADCDLIDMWFFTRPALEAGLALQAIRARDGLEPVADSVWTEAGALTQDAAGAMRRWSEAPPVRTEQMRPIVAEHRRRIICQAFAPLVQMRNLRGRGSPAWEQLYVSDYPAWMQSAVETSAFASSGDDPALAVESYCGSFGGA